MGKTKDMDLPIILKKTLKVRGWTVKGLARAADINPTTLYANLKGEAQMHLGTALKFVAALRLPQPEDSWELLGDLQRRFEAKQKNHP